MIHDSNAVVGAVYMYTNRWYTLINIVIYTFKFFCITLQYYLDPVKKISCIHIDYVWHILYTY